MHQNRGFSCSRRMEAILYALHDVAYIVNRCSKQKGMYIDQFVSRFRPFLKANSPESKLSRISTEAGKLDPKDLL